MQDRFDRRVGRRRIHQQPALLAHHLDVRQRLEAGERGEFLQSHRRQAGRLDRAHVPAAALDAKNLDLAAVRVPNDGLDRGIAAAMENQLRVAAEEAGRIDTGRQIGVQAGSDIAVDDGSKLRIRPTRFHRGELRKAARRADIAGRDSVVTRAPSLRGASATKQSRGRREPFDLWIASLRSQWRILTIARDPPPASPAGVEGRFAGEVAAHFLGGCIRGAFDRLQRGAGDVRRERHVIEAAGARGRRERARRRRSRASRRADGRFSAPRSARRNRPSARARC